MKTLTERFAIPRDHVFRHLDLQSTLCPGRLFPWHQVTAGLAPHRSKTLDQIVDREAMRSY